MADRFRVEQKRRREGLRLKYGHAITTLSQSVTPPGHRHPRDWHALSAAAPHHRAGRAAASACTSTATKAATPSRGSSSTATAESYASHTAKARKTSSPLQHEHILMLGTFPFTLPHELADGQRRRLRIGDGSA